MSALSTFDGISCGRVALERAGIGVNKYFASEVDEKAMKVSKKNYPDIIQVGDVSKIRGNKTHIDLLLGGSPCQGFSRAGKGENFEDPRSMLFYQYVRILKELKKNNPDVKFLLENVCMKKEWQDIISDHLGVQPVKINSKFFLPHNRPRVYWTNIDYDKNFLQKEYDIKDYLDDSFPEKNYINQKTCDAIILEKKSDHLIIKNATIQGWLKAYPGDCVSVSFPNSKTRRGRVKKNMVGCLTTKLHEAIVTEDLKLRYLTMSEIERLQGLPVGYTDCLSQNQREKVIGNGWTIDVIAHILKGLKG